MKKLLLLLMSCTSVAEATIKFTDCSKEKCATDEFPVLQISGNNVSYYDDACPFGTIYFNGLSAPCLKKTKIDISCSGKLTWKIYEGDVIPDETKEVIVKKGEIKWKVKE